MYQSPSIPCLGIRKIKLTLSPNTSVISVIAIAIIRDMLVKLKIRRFSYGRYKPTLCNARYIGNCNRLK